MNNNAYRFRRYKMGIKKTYPIRSLILISSALLYLPLPIMASKINRVVFKFFALPDGEPVQCYGRCDLRREFNVSRCDGWKIKFSCQSGHQIQVTMATLGELNPELPICGEKQTLACSKDVVRELRTMCRLRRVCTVDVTNDQLGNSCGKMKYPAMDIRYTCVIKPITDAPNTIFPIMATTTTTTTTAIITINNKPYPSNKVVKTLPTTTTTTSSSSVTTLPHPTVRKTNFDNGSLIVDDLMKDSDMFWSMSAYIAITNSELIKKHKTHLALALLLSMFVGLVLCLCFCLDYCRRRKQKRDNKTQLVPDFQAVESNERVELIKPKMVEVIALNGSLPKHKMVPCSERGYVDNAVEDSNVYNVSTPFFQRSLEHQQLKPNRVDLNQERPFPPSYLPPPPKHFLHESSSSSSIEILPPPPNDFIGEKNNIMMTSTPTGSDTVRPSHNALSRNTPNEEVVEELYLEELPSDKNVESALYEYMEVGQYHASDEYSSSPHISRSMSCHRTDNHVEPSRVKFAPMSRRAPSNDVTPQEDTFIRNIDFKRMRKCSQRGHRDKCRSSEETKRKNYFANGNSNQYLLRNPRRGRIHVMQSCDESVPQRSCTQKVIYSDNEASRRRRRCDLEYKRSCSCNEQGVSLNDLYCTRCGKSEETHLNACSSLTSNCQSSHDEDNHGPLLSISNERIKNKQYRVEESGYQSHDTGTDSLCSSTFSTDQEDSRMFLPASLSNCLHNGCRSKACHIRLHASKRDPNLILVGNHKSKLPRRCHRGDITNIVHHHHSDEKTVDTRLYDNSSMDDGSSRDSVKIFQEIRQKNARDMGEEICVYGIVQADSVVEGVYGIVQTDNVVEVGAIETA